jgi:pimeloyl-ACP methyl ester carboxylesterase
MKHITLQDTELVYIDRGHGVPVIFVHGTVSDFRSWKLQISHFSHQFRAIAYSRRYHYPNPLPPASTAYSAAVHADDLRSFLDAIQVDRAHIVGGSFGGYVSLVFALRCPDRVLSLTLAEPPILPFLLRSEEGKTHFDAFMNTAWLPARNARLKKVFDCSSMG